MREEGCLYWPVKYSSNEAGAGGDVRQEMEMSPLGKEHRSSGNTRERVKQIREEGKEGEKETVLLCGSCWFQSQIL